MDKKTFDEHCYNLMDQVHEVLNKKGPEYQTNEDVFSNFITIGKQLGLTEYQIWSVYFHKHISSINNSIKNNPTNPDNKDMPESLDSRIIDAIAYLSILYAMYKRY